MDKPQGNRVHDLVSRAKLLMENGHEYAEYMDSRKFRDGKIEAVLFSSGFDALSLPSTSWYKPTLNPESGDGQTHLMPPEEEKLMFLCFNYAKLKLNELKKALAGKMILHRDAEEFMLWHGRFVFLREYIARSNLALTLAMAKRLNLQDVDFMDIVSEVNEALLRAINKFNVERGFKFSTYACRAIIRSLGRLRIKEVRRYSRSIPYEEGGCSSTDWRDFRRGEQRAYYLEQLDEIVRGNRAKLTYIEKSVLRHRFNLGEKNKTPLTLKETGQIIGVTKERVRQIQNKALRKIRVEMLLVA